MTFDELEVGKEYEAGRYGVVRLVDKGGDEAVIRRLNKGNSQPFHIVSPEDAADWRPYTPPPAPVVRYAYARLYPNDTAGSANASSDEGHATNDPRRIGPVIKIELPVCPDMLARVRDGAK